MALLHKIDKSFVIPQELPCDAIGHVILPVHVVAPRVDNTVLSFGTIVHDRDAFHSPRYIFPVGYRSQRMYFSLTTPQARGDEGKSLYTFEIVDGGEAPSVGVALCTLCRLCADTIKLDLSLQQFQVTPVGFPDRVFSGMVSCEGRCARLFLTLTVPRSLFAVTQALQLRWLSSRYKMPLPRPGSEFPRTTCLGWTTLDYR